MVVGVVQGLCSWAWRISMRTMALMVGRAGIGIGIGIEAVGMGMGTVMVMGLEGALEDAGGLAGGVGQ